MKRWTTGKVIAVAALAILSVIVMLPFIWMVLTSFKTYKQTIKVPLVWLPTSFYLENYTEVLTKMDFTRYYLNTLLVTVGITIPQLIFSAMAAYAFARLNFPGKNVIFLVLMAALMIPLQMVLLPRFLVLIRLGWVNTFWGVIVPEIASIYGTFFIRQQFMTLPKELDESAELDGCSYPRIFWSILLPLCSSTIIAMGILTVVFAWNNFLWPLITLQDTKKYVLSIAIANLQGQHMTKYNLLTTASVLSTMPILIAFVVGQNYFLDGIATSGIKA